MKRILLPSMCLVEASSKSLHTLRLKGEFQRSFPLDPDCPHDPNHYSPHACIVSSDFEPSDDNVYPAFFIQQHRPSLGPLAAPESSDVVNVSDARMVYQRKVGNDTTVNREQDLSLSRTL